MIHSFHTDDERIARLEAENANLRLRIAELEDEGKIAAPRSWAFTTTELKLFAALMRRDLLTHEGGMEILYPDDRRFEVGINIIKVNITKMRRKCEGDQIRIENVHGQGYRLSPETKARVRALIEAEGA